VFIQDEIAAYRAYTEAVSGRRTGLNSELLICGSMVFGRQEVFLFWGKEVRWFRAA